MLKNLGLTQRYKIVSSVRSRISGQLYKVETTESNKSYLMLVLSLPEESLSDREQHQLEQLSLFLNSCASAESLEALSLEGSQLIAVQSWSNIPTLDQDAQISVKEGRQLLIQGLELVQAAQEAGVHLSGLQSDNLTWDGKTLKIMPFGAIAAQITQHPVTDLAQLASSVIWAVTRLLIEPGKVGQFWQAQIQLEDPDLRQVLENLLLQQVTQPKDAFTLLELPDIVPSTTTQPANTLNKSKSLYKEEAKIKAQPVPVPTHQESTQLILKNPPLSSSKEQENSWPVVAGIVGGFLGIIALIALPITIATISNRSDSTNVETNLEQQEQLQRELEETRRELKQAREAAARPSSPSAVTPSARKNPGTIPSSVEWQPSCGSPSGSGTTWWPVKAEASSLQVMKEVYCGDSYIRGSDVQVASFTNQPEAQEFASLIASETGYRVFVDSPIYLD